MKVEVKSRVLRMWNQLYSDVLIYFIYSLGGLRIANIHKFTLTMYMHPTHVYPLEKIITRE